MSLHSLTGSSSSTSLRLSMPAHLHTFSLYVVIMWELVLSSFTPTLRMGLAHPHLLMMSSCSYAAKVCERIPRPASFAGSKGLWQWGWEIGSEPMKVRCPHFKGSAMPTTKTVQPPRLPTLWPNRTHLVIINFFCTCDPGLRRNCMACVWSHSLHDYDQQ